MGKTTCRKFCRTRVFAVKLGIISCFIYGTYFILYLLLDDSNVELKSPLKRLIINSVLRKQTKTTGPEECPVPRFNSSLPQPHDGCQRLTPVKGSCQLANKLFFSSPPDTCQHQLKTEICKIIESDGKLNVDCSDRICAEQKVSLGEINRKSGELEWQDFPSTKNLETHLRKVLSSKTDNYGFYFIRCAINVDEIKEEVADEVINSNIGMEDEYIMVDVVAQQLLLIPPFVKKTLKSHNHINVNILFIDSVSHSHFLRSLPKTLQTLRELHGTSVFNYELFQSLKGRTYENLQALFSGELYDVEKPFGLQDMPPSPVNLGRLFAGFKMQGFETMYTEDLCWQWEWGLVKNLLAYMPGDDVEKRWKIFTKSLKKAGIDRIDMTLASCEILTDNQHHDPFHGPAAICYNGQYQHHYILEYLGKRQELLKKNNKPFFHNTLLNVGHDDYGRRIQTLDYDLAEYLKMASKLRNTLTFILSDHGNTYGEYIKQNEEARVEMFHSVLFMLVPPGVAETLGPTRLNSLRINQQRLVSILDLHYALRFLSETKLGNLDEKHKKYFIKPDGIFSEIPSNRSCSDIPRIEPNVCICQDFEKVASKDERYTLLAEFALGTINNAIQEQYRKSNPDTKRGFGSCQRLVAHHFGNIKQRTNKNGDNEVKMDLYIPNPDTSTSMEIFMVILIVPLKNNEDIKLVTYERMTPYSPFETCSDKGVTTKLCICSLSKTQHQLNQNEIPPPVNLPPTYPAIFDTKTEIKPIHDKCLFIFTRRNKVGVVLEASNQCTDRIYSLKLDITTTNMILSSGSPVKADLWPGMMSFFVVMTQMDNSHNWDFNYTVDYNWKDV